MLNKKFLLLACKILKSYIQCVKEYIEKGNGDGSRSSNGANEKSSRSHAILQLVIKKQGKGKYLKGGRTIIDPTIAREGDS